jgi:hypothetical protein
MHIERSWIGQCSGFPKGELQILLAKQQQQHFLLSAETSSFFTSV